MLGAQRPIEPGDHCQELSNHQRNGDRDTIHSGLRYDMRIHQQMIQISILYWTTRLI